MRTFRSSSLPRQLAVLGLSGAACVVPMGPEFETTPNRPPYVVSATPPIGGTIPRMMGVARTASVILADQDPKDALHYRWLVDYPPASDASNQILLPGAISPPLEDKQLTAAAPCDGLSVGTHRLTLAVSDRAFLPPDQAPRPEEKLTALDVARGAHGLTMQWLYDCP